MSSKKSTKGPGNRPALRPMVRGNSIKNTNRAADPKRTDLRDKNKINRLKMQNAKPVRAKDGSLISGAFMSKTVDAKVKRIQPDRRWFGNTRTVGQKQLEDFRDEMKTKVNDPYTFVMRTNKLPMGLLTDKFKNSKMDLLSSQSFDKTYSKNHKQKKPKLNSSSLAEMVDLASKKADSYVPTKDGVDLTNIEIKFESTAGLRD